MCSDICVEWIDLRCVFEIYDRSDNIAETKMLLADEPTANVDSHTADMLLDMMEKLNQDQGVTFLFSTHDPRVMDRASRVIRLVDGRIETDDVRA